MRPWTQTTERRPADDTRSPSRRRAGFACHGLVGGAGGVDARTRDIAGRFIRRSLMRDGFWGKGRGGGGDRIHSRTGGTDFLLGFVEDSVRSTSSLCYWYSLAIQTQHRGGHKEQRRRVSESSFDAWILCGGMRGGRLGQRMGVRGESEAGRRKPALARVGGRPLRTRDDARPSKQTESRYRPSPDVGALADDGDARLPG